MYIEGEEGFWVLIIVGELNLNIRGCKEQNVLFTQKKKKIESAQQNLIPLNFR